MKISWSECKTQEEADARLGVVVVLRVLDHGFAYHGHCTTCGAGLAFSLSVVQCPACGRACMLKEFVGDARKAEAYALLVASTQTELRA